MGLSRESLKGTVQTVLGPVPPDQLGITLAHEHCLIDLTSHFFPPKEASIKKIALEPLSLKNLGYVRYNPQNSLDNLTLLDEELAIRELKRARRIGVRSLVDATNYDLGRDPRALVRIANETGLNIVMGSGYYVKLGQTQEMMQARSEEDIAEEIIQEVLEREKATGVPVGLIGEIGCSWPLEECEKKVLRAAGLAQKETGAPLDVHPGRNEAAVAQIITILKEVGTDLSRTAMAHIDRTLFEPKNRYALADEGCYLAYDLWGNEGYYPAGLAVCDIPNDTQRIGQIKDLFARGYGDQLLLSHDICYKLRYFEYGGHGYTHILENAVPAMKIRGLGEEQINALLIENPKRWLTFA